MLQNNHPIKIFFAGDFCSKPSTSLIAVSEELKQLMAECDLRVVNFEVPLKPAVELPKQERERFFQNDDAPAFLLNLGFDLFSIANNHTFDWGEAGYRKTVAALPDKTFGAGTYEQAYEVKVVDIKGVKIGFLAVSFAAYKGVFDDMNDHEGLGCAYINDLKVNHVILEAKKNVDYLYILPHDGIEYIDVPLPETMARYRDFIDYGADGVIGCHPHCPQGWETYKGKPIFYSLGNFFFNSKEDTLYRAYNRPHWYEGRCAIITINEEGVGWQVVNTRNKDNIAIELDYCEESRLHNEAICHFLQDKVAYDAYLAPVMEKLFHNAMRLMRKSFNPKSVREALGMVKGCLKMKIRGQKPYSNNEMIFMLKNDLKRNQIVKMNTNS